MNKKNVVSLFLFLSINLLLSGCKEDDGTSAEPQVSTSPFAGNWKLIRFDETPFVGNVVWSFSDTSVSITTSTPVFSGSYSYNPNSDPKTIDISFTGETPDPNLAIYEFIGTDTLVLKVMDGAADRATNLEVEEGYDLEEFIKE